MNTFLTYGWPRILTKFDLVRLTIFFLALVVVNPGPTIATPPSSDEGGTGCSAIDGVYEYEGQAVDGFPNYYRALKSPLTLDRLLGVYVFGKKMAQITAVEVVGRERVEVVLWGAGGIVDRLPLGRSDDRITCERGVLQLEQDLEVAGDGAHNRLHIVRELSCESEQSLKVAVKIRGTGRTLFLFTYELVPEEYRAVFVRK